MSFPDQRYRDLHLLPGWVVAGWRRHPVQDLCRRVVLVDADGRLPHETRQSAIRLICAVGGRPWHDVADAGGARRIVMTPGTVMVVVPRRPVSAAPDDTGAMFNTLIGERHLAFRVMRRRAGRVVEERFHSRPARCWPTALDLLRLIVAARTLDSEHPYLVSLARALLEIARLEAAKATAPASGAERFRAVCGAIDELLPAPVSRSRVARIVGVHPAHLSRLCAQHGDDSFPTLVLRRRLRIAGDALRRDQGSISAAAAAAGFSSASYFCQACRRVLGITPAALRDHAGPRGQEED